MTAATVDPVVLDAAVARINLRMRSHAGAITVTTVRADGVVEVAFDGMCRGCPYKALTLHGTVRPGLTSVPGVTGVEAPGARISAEAAERLARCTGGG